jgi:hypothetical protein
MVGPGSCDASFGCHGEVIVECACVRCAAEPDESAATERFHSCVDHFDEVAEIHMCIRERPVVWRKL